jgi:hypothetical protein
MVVQMTPKTPAQTAATAKARAKAKPPKVRKAASKPAGLVIQDAATIGKMIDAAIEHTVKGDGIIHDAAVQCLGHASVHGDCTLLDRLIKGVGKSVRVEGLKVWAGEFSPIRWNGDGKVGILKVGQKGFTSYQVEKANLTPFWTLAAADERTARPMTIDQVLKVIHGLKGRIEKAKTEGRFDGDPEAAMGLVEAVATFTDGYVAKHPDVARDGAFDPNDPDNAVPAPAPAPRRARTKAV